MSIRVDTGTPIHVRISDVPEKSITPEQPAEGGMPPGLQSIRGEPATDPRQSHTVRVISGPRQAGAMQFNGPKLAGAVRFSAARQAGTTQFKRANLVKAVARPSAAAVAVGRAETASEAVVLHEEDEFIDFENAKKLERF